MSPISGRNYRLNKKLSCVDGGTTGKTTTAFNKRFCEHFSKSSSLAVFDHSKHCQVGKNRENFSNQFLESVHSLKENTCDELSASSDYVDVHLNIRIRKYVCDGERTDQELKGIVHGKMRIEFKP